MNGALVKKKIIIIIKYWLLGKNFKHFNPLFVFVQGKKGEGKERNFI